MRSLGPEIAAQIEGSSKGVSMILGPTGAIVSDTMCEKEGLVLAEIDLADAVEQKRIHDVVGYYNRFDVFKLSVNRTRIRPIHFSSDASYSSESEDEFLPLDEPRTAVQRRDQ
jgi:aliphatic nitrilase